MKNLRKLLLCGLAALSSLTLLATPVYALKEDGTDLVEPTIFAEEMELFTLLNDYRESIGLNKLVYDSDLQDEAYIRCNELSEEFSHKRPDGSFFFEFSERFTAESIAKGSLTQTAQEVFDGWLNDSSAKWNLRYTDFKSVAVKVLDKDGVRYWCVAYGEDEAVRPYDFIGEPAFIPSQELILPDGTSVMIPSASGTYKETFDYAKSLGYVDFKIVNFWNSEVNFWFNLSDCKVSLIDNSVSVPKDPEPTEELTEISFTLNGEDHVVLCGKTYEEVFEYVDGLGYTSYEVRNAWNSIVEKWYNLSGNSVKVIILDTSVPKDPEDTEELTEISFTLNDEEHVVLCGKTYKEVFEYIDELGYTSYEVRNEWNSIIEKWFNVSGSTIKVTILDTNVPKDPEPTVEIYEATFVWEGNEYIVPCLSGTYREAFLKIQEVVGDEAYVVVDQWNSPLQIWYKINCSNNIKVNVLTAEVN